MKLQNLTVIFIIIVLPVILLVSLYISTGLKTIKYQSLYDTGLLTATHDAIYAFEQNTASDDFSGNPDKKRDIIKSSVKVFEKSLCSTCGISSYNLEEIERYIPAIVFGMYDGFYMYAPSLKYDENDQKEYTHSLKNYVYYSETLNDGTVIRYSLDNYVVVSGDFGNNYEVKSGYLINIDDWNNDSKAYKGIKITSETIDGKENTDAIKYYEDAYNFTDWFLNNVEDKPDYLEIDSDNNPEDEASAFVQHKRSVIKQKLESVLNSSITAYSQRLSGQNYKMPKLSEEDWQKIYDNISVISFFQGKKIGLTEYNGYCVLNCTNSNEYVNSNLMYFIEGTDDINHEYHDIRCDKLISTEENLIGYRIGDFGRRKVEVEIEKENEEGNIVKEKVERYEFKHNSLGCYNCANGPIKTDKTVYEYIEGLNKDDSDELKIMKAYYTSLARERYNTTKLQ